MLLSVAKKELPVPELLGQEILLQAGATRRDRGKEAGATPDT